MRTTLTLDDDVSERLNQEMRSSGKGQKALVNEALRLGLGMVSKPKAPIPFRVHPHSFGFKAGIDLDRVNQLVDEMDSEEAARRLRE